MGIIDIILVCLFLPALYFGIKNGFVKQAVSALVIYFGITLSLKFSNAVATWISGFATIPEFWLKVISFIVIFFAVAMVLNLFSKLLEKIIKITLLGWLNRLLGVVAAICIFGFILSLLIFFIDSANELTGFIPKEKIAESNIYPFLLKCSKTIFPYLKQLF